MSLWIILTFIAQFLNAAALLVDKFVLAKKVISRPIVYAFYVNLLSFVALGVVFFLPITMPNVHTFVLYLSQSALYTAAICFLYRALSKAEASDVAPVVGGVTAIVTFILAYIFLNEKLPPHFILAVLFLSSGTLFISHFRFSLSTVFDVALSGIFFASAWVMLKYIFTIVSFADGFLWTRNAAMLISIALFFLPWSRRLILESIHESSYGMKSLVVVNFHL